MVLAGLVGAGPDRAGLLRDFLQQDGVTAVGAGLGDGLLPRCEFAIGITAATIKCLFESRAAHHNFTRAAFFRAGNSQRFALHVFARGIIAARGELAVAAVFNHQVVAALGALFLQRLIATVVALPSFITIFLVLRHSGYPVQARK